MNRVSKVILLSMNLGIGCGLWAAQADRELVTRRECERLLVSEQLEEQENKKEKDETIESLAAEMQFKGQALQEKTRLALGREKTAQMSSDELSDALIALLEGLPDVVSELVREDMYESWLNTDAKIEIIPLNYKKLITAVAISPDNTFIVTGPDDEAPSGDKTVRIWNAQTGAVIHRLAGHTSRVNSITISPDNKLIATGSADKTVKIWDVKTGKLQRTLKQPASVRAVAMSADGNFIITGTADKTVRIWDIKSGKERFGLEHGGAVRSVALSADGSLIVTGAADNRARIWDAKTRALIHELPCDNLLCVAISSDNSIVVAGCEDNTAQVWNAKTGLLIHELAGHTDPINSIAISPDNNFIVTGSKDKSARIWNAQTGDLIRILVGHTKPITSVAISPDLSFIVTGSVDKTARIWRLSLHPATLRAEREKKEKIKAKKRSWRRPF